MATNLALNQSCTASSQYAAKERANDGNYGTTWIASGNNNQWWRVDLGSQKTFNTWKIQIHPSVGFSFVLEANNDDGVSWGLIVTVPHAVYSTLTTFNFVAVTYRYVRVRFTDNANWSHIYECELYNITASKGLFTFIW